jgi:ABC-type transporter Mla subunit MlaD
MDELHDRQEQQERWAQALHRLTTQNDQILQRLDELMGTVCASAVAVQSKPPVKPTGN